MTSKVHSKGSCRARTGTPVKSLEESSCTSGSAISIRCLSTYNAKACINSRNKYSPYRRWRSPSRRDLARRKQNNSPIKPYHARYPFPCGLSQPNDTAAPEAARFTRALVDEPKTNPPRPNPNRTLPASNIMLPAELADFGCRCLVCSLSDLFMLGFGTLLSRWISAECSIAALRNRNNFMRPRSEDPLVIHL